MNESTQSTDHYNNLISAMQPGLLITVNNSGGANAQGSHELRVVKHTADDAVLLSGHGEYEFKLHPADGDLPILEKVTGGLLGNDDRPVETIEVVGIAE